MDDLDFSGLSDDQLIGLVRAALRECVARNPAVEAAAKSACLDEAESAKIAVEAAQREAAALRAKERERVAREAAKRVRQAAATQDAAAKSYQSREAGRQAAIAASQQEQQDREWLRRTAELVGRDPAGISLISTSTDYGWRVLVNEGADRYAREHLVDWRAKDNTITTTRELVGRKADLTALCAEFRAAHQPRESVALVGANYDWSQPQPQPQEAEPCPTN